MRVVLLTESGTGIGGGHRSRCEAVAQAFEEHGDSAQILLERQEETAGAEDTPRIRHAAWSRDEDLLRGTLQGVDAAVVDSYRAPAELYALIAGLVAVTACFDDTRRLDYPPGVVINSSIGVRDQDYPEQPGRHYLLGPRFIPLRAPFWEAGPKKTRAQPRLVVSYVGDTDPRRLRGLIARSVAKVFPGSRILFLGAGTAPHGAELRDHVKAEEMKDLLTEADVAVTGGGQILNELARVGVPTVAIGLADNQYSNLEGWQARGFIELAGWWDTPSLSAGVESCLSAFVHLEERRHRTEIGRALVDGQGSRRIRSEIAQWS